MASNVEHAHEGAYAENIEGQVIVKKKKRNEIFKNPLLENDDSKVTNRKVHQN